jgi:hypothetical protein
MKRVLAALVLVGGIMAASGATAGRHIVEGTFAPGTEGTVQFSTPFWNRLVGVFEFDGATLQSASFVSRVGSAPGVGCTASVGSSCKVIPFYPIGLAVAGDRLDFDTPSSFDLRDTGYLPGFKVVTPPVVSTFTFDFAPQSEPIEVRYRAEYVTVGIPEASTWALMLFGFGGIGSALRRQVRGPNQPTSQAAS